MAKENSYSKHESKTISEVESNEHTGCNKHNQGEEMFISIKCI